MKKTIRKFFAKISHALFTARVNREITQKIFPQINQEADCGYPFSSQAEMVKLHVRGNLHASLNLRLIERTAAKMPKAEGDAFRYIAYRDLNAQMEKYLQFAEEREYNDECDPRFGEANTSSCMVAVKTLSPCSILH